MAGDIKIDSETLFEVVESVVKTMASVTTERQPAGALSGPMATGVISITGERRFVLVLSMSQELAVLLAGKILQEEIASWNPNVQDVLGELCNVIAGNLKRHLMPGLTLGLPAVVRGEEYEISTPRMVPATIEEFAVAGRTLRIRLGSEV